VLKATPFFGLELRYLWFDFKDFFDKKMGRRFFFDQ